MDVQEIIETLLNWLMWIGLSALALIAGGCVCVWLYGSVRSVAAWAWRSRTWFEKFTFTGLLTGCILFAGTKANSPLLLQIPFPPALPQSVVQTVTEDEITQGWRLESVVTNDTVSYSMPTNDFDSAPETPLVPSAWNQSEEWAAVAFPSNAAEIAAAGGYAAWATAQGTESGRRLVSLGVSFDDGSAWPTLLDFIRGDA